MVFNKAGSKVSILWLNYNSYRFIAIVLDSLDSLLNIDYDNFEIVIIDNGSDDKSLEIIEDFIEKAKLGRDLPPIKVIRNKHNLGFTGGNHIGYKHRAEDSKYVATINNDLIVEGSSMKPLVRYLEEHADVGAVQGKITTWDGDKIDNCGFYFDSMYRVYARYNGYRSSKDVKEAEVSYASGCYSVYSVDALEECGGLFGFILPYFGYFEDADMGLRLWRKGCKTKSLSIMAGRHKGGPSYSHPLKNYLDGRNRLSSIMNLTDARRFMVIPWTTYFLSRILIYIGLSFLRNREYKTRAKYATLALVNGFSLARRTQKIEGNALEPHIKLCASTAVKMMLLPSYVAPKILSFVNDRETYRITV